MEAVTLSAQLPIAQKLRIGVWHSIRDPSAASASPRRSLPALARGRRFYSVLHNARPRASYESGAGWAQLQGRHDGFLFSLTIVVIESGARTLFSGAGGAKNRVLALQRSKSFRGRFLCRAVRCVEGPIAKDPRVPRRSSFERLCRSQSGPQRGRANVSRTCTRAGELVHRPLRCGAARAQRTAVDFKHCSLTSTESTPKN